MIKILLLDDDMTQYVIIQRFLQRVEHQSYDVKWAENSHDAFQMLESDSFDICIVDYNLIETKGSDFIRQAIRQGHSIPFVLLTSSELFDVDIEAMNSGAVDFLNKEKINHHALERSIRYAITRKQSENDFKSVLDTAFDGIIVIDYQGMINKFNPAAEGLFGYAKEEVLGKNVKMLMPEPVKSNHDGYLKNYLETGVKNIISRGREVTALRKDGTEFPVYLSVGEMKDGSSGYVGIIHDITEEKKAYNLIVEQQKQLHQELDNARETQKALLPKSFPKIQNATIAAKYEPATKVGGDFYNVVELQEGKVGILLVDVSGHGVSAALVSFMVSVIFNQLYYLCDTPETLVAQMNESLCNDMPEGMFASLFYGIYDPHERKLTYTSAGHPPAILLRKDALEPVFLDSKGMLVGIFPPAVAEYEEQSQHLAPGDKLVVYTDGTFEAMDEHGAIMGLDQFASHLVELKQRPIKEVLELIFDQCKEFSATDTLNDDITLVGLEIL